MEVLLSMCQTFARFGFSLAMQHHSHPPLTVHQSDSVSGGGFTMEDCSDTNISRWHPEMTDPFSDIGTIQPMKHKTITSDSSRLTHRSTWCRGAPGRWACGTGRAARGAPGHPRWWCARCTSPGSCRCPSYRRSPRRRRGKCPPRMRTPLSIRFFQSQYFCWDPQMDYPKRSGM